MSSLSAIKISLKCLRMDRVRLTSSETSTVVLRRYAAIPLTLGRELFLSPAAGRIDAFRPKLVLGAGSWSLSAAGGARGLGGAAGAVRMKRWMPSWLGGGTAGVREGRGAGLLDQDVLDQDEGRGRRATVPTSNKNQGH
jgi:hypothetical protein